MSYLQMVQKAFNRKVLPDNNGNNCKLSDEIFQLREEVKDDPDYKKGLLVRKIAYPSKNPKKPGHHDNIDYCYVCGLFKDKAEFVEVKKDVLFRVGSVKDLNNVKDILNGFFE